MVVNNNISLYVGYTSSLFCLCLLVIMVDMKRSPSLINRRQESPPEEESPDGIPPGGLPPGFQLTTGAKEAGGMADMERFTTPSTTQRRVARTTPLRVSFEESCDYLAHYCLKAYTTGSLCGRTIYYTYHTFKNYCLLDYVNCMERYEVWQVVHMGECFNITQLTEYLLYPYDDDYFLDQYYVMEDH